MKYLLALVLSLALTLFTPMLLKQNNGSEFMTLTQQSALDVQTYIGAYKRIYRALTHSTAAISSSQPTENQTEMKMWRDGRGVWHFTDPTVENPVIYEDQIIKVENDANSRLYSAPSNTSLKSMNAPDVFAYGLMFMTFFTFSAILMIAFHFLFQARQE